MKNEEKNDENQQTVGTLLSHATEVELAGDHVTPSSTARRQEAALR